ncbi:MAG: HupE/UreJ family protein [Leptothrix sp. (in: b-proteobacteria)]
MAFKAGLQGGARIAAQFALLASLAALSGGASAHKASDAYLTLAVHGSQVEQRWDIALRDLDRELDLNQAGDGQLRWGEVRPRWADIDAFAAQALTLSVDGQACKPGPVGPALLDEHSDGRYAVLTRTWTCAGAVQHLSIGYRLFADSDPTHRGIVRLTRGANNLADTGAGQTAVLVPGAAAVLMQVGDGPNDATAATPANGTPQAANASEGWLGFVREGIHHILTGYDHLMFLLALLLPSVLWLRSGGTQGAGHAATESTSIWHPAERSRVALTDVVKVVSAFTLAHSITLALAALDVLNPPSRWIESLIAASVVFAAVNNLRPMVREGRWRLTFAFGLIHGFGFAAALKDLGLGARGLIAPLLGFNLGVEIGQLGLVALFLPLAWALRRSRFYRVVLLQGGSALIAALALVWLIERVGDLQIIGF